jgi:hypothetical protein
MLTLKGLDGFTLDQIIFVNSFLTIESFKNLIVEIE